MPLWTESIHTLSVESSLKIVWNSVVQYCGVISEHCRSIVHKQMYNTSVVATYCTSKSHPTKCSNILWIKISANRKRTSSTCSYIAHKKMRNKKSKHLPAHLYLINRTMTTNKPLQGVLCMCFMFAVRSGQQQQKRISETTK